MHVHIEARRWFDSVNGNTYHAARVTVEHDDGRQEVVGIVPFAYGYGNHYLVTAGDLLSEHGLIDGSGYDFASWRWREERGIAQTESVEDVRRKRDLVPSWWTEKPSERASLP